MLFQSWAVAALSAASLLIDGTLAFTRGKFTERNLKRSQRAQRELERLQDLQERQAATSSYGPGFRYLNSETSPYLVKSLPDVPFNVGELYSGNFEINAGDPSRQLFFVFQPTIGTPVDEITIWLNGGPGCSSLEGFFQENGRFLWQPGTFAPVENPYSWVNLTNMLWVEQPIGTGFTIGNVTANDEEEIAQDFIKAFKNFQEIFGIKNYKIYVTGESYAGRYIPYFSAAMLDADDKEYYNVQGALLYDPCIGQFDYVQEEVPTVPYVVENNNFFNFNASFIAQLQELHESCGYAEYIEKYLTFPPPGPQPPVYFNYTSEANCDVFDLVNFAAFDPNPCFDIYEINTQCPLLWDVLSFPTELVYTPAGATTYFNRADVKAAIHAPQDITWTECSVNPVFTGWDAGTGPESEGDTSPDPIQKVLPQVIEATNRVLVANGDYDMVILTQGTLLSIQNMTWNGKLGFQSAPSTPINITMPDLMYASVFAEPANGIPGWDGPQGVMGIQHYERGLLWAETYQSGHMEPEYQPRSAYRHLLWVLGYIDVL